MLAMGVGLLLVGRFVATFEIFGLPVYSKQAGWLGPTPRDAGDCVEDAGKVNVWRCEDTSVFASHRFGTRLWLRTFGFDNAPE